MKGAKRESMLAQEPTVYKEPAPITDNVSHRIGAYVLAIDKVARTLKLRGIYA